MDKVELRVLYVHPRVSESTGIIIETQDVLSHKHAATARAYVQRVAVKAVTVAQGHDFGRTVLECVR